METNKNIAVAIFNYIQYINIKPGIDELIKKYNVDIYCPENTESDLENMFSHNVKYLKEHGYNVYTKATSKEYQVLLEPYPSYMNIKSKYKIKYRYANMSAKPDIVYLPENLIRYDAILCSGEYDSGYLCNYAQTYITGNLKYLSFNKRTNNKTKKVLLYLPTYGKESSIDSIGNTLQELKKDYYVIVKIHHGTSWLDKEKNRIEKIKEQSDEFYDFNMGLGELLEKTDVVLTDNSASIFDAIQTKTPVAVFCDDININKNHDFNTTQYELYKEGILPYTNNRKQIKGILEEALSKRVIKKQSEWNDKNFYKSENPVKDFVKVIEKYMSEDINHRYIQMHRVFQNNYYSKIKEIEKLENDKHFLLSEIKDLNKKNIELENKLEVYNNSKLYLWVSYLYKIKNKLIKK